MKKSCVAVVYVYHYTPPVIEVNALIVVFSGYFMDALASLFCFISMKLTLTVLEGCF